jgi:phage-related protein
MAWTIELFTEDDGRQPVREWILALDPEKRASVIAAIETFLTKFGLDLCGTEHAKHLGEGLFELRIRHEESIIRRKAGQETGPAGKRGGRREILLRVFCHAYGDRIIVLVGGYDKGADSSSRRQTREIERARRRLRTFKLRAQRVRLGHPRRA